jgi:protein ImuB
MHWIALSPPAPERSAWGWWALRFTPRVTQLDEALLLEVSASLRLWGGRQRLLRQLLEAHPFEALAGHAQGATALVALALLRLARRGEAAPPALPDPLPLDTLSAALPHLGTLARAGCRRWGELRALPRGGVARRFGAALLDALDAAYGERPETYPWLTLPEHFDVRLELPALAASAPELMWTAQRLLAQLQAWLQARQRGVLALELEWTLDLRRLDGADLPPHERLAIRTAQPTQDMAHLRRLMAEQLARATLSAPANQLRLRSLETAPWAGASQSFLPDEQAQGERLHQLVERLSVRLGAGNVVQPQALADHRPERMQRWVPAQAGVTPVSGAASDALYPTWLLPQPLALPVRGEQPCCHGPLQLLSSEQRLESGWWEAGGLAARDYFIAGNETAGLVWIYRERLPGGQGGARWFLHGIF